MNRIYIAGPITDADPAVQQKNLQAFSAKAAELRGQGHHVTNPAENGLPGTASWAEHMRTDIRDMMDCDTIYMLPGWSRSNGAQLERLIAMRLGFAVLGGGV